MNLDAVITQIKATLAQHKQEEERCMAIANQHHGAAEALKSLLQSIEPADTNVTDSQGDEPSADH
jgi:hypothetical protein